jgi:hypothetical protein
LQLKQEIKNELAQFEIERCRNFSNNIVMPPTQLGEQIFKALDNPQYSQV